MIVHHNAARIAHNGERADLDPPKSRRGLIIEAKTTDGRRVMYDDSIDRAEPDGMNQVLSAMMTERAKLTRAVMRFKRDNPERKTPRLVKSAGVPVPSKLGALLRAADKRIEPERKKPMPTGYDPRTKLSTNYSAHGARADKFWQGGYGARPAASRA